MNFSRHMTMKSTRATLWRIRFTGRLYDICLRQVSRDLVSIPGKIVERHYVTHARKLPAQMTPTYAILEASTWHKLTHLKRWKSLLSLVLPFSWLAPSTRISLLPGSIRFATKIAVLDSVSWDSTNGCYVIIGSTDRTKN